MGGRILVSFESDVGVSEYTKCRWAWNGVG